MKMLIKTLMVIMLLGGNIVSAAALQLEVSKVTIDGRDIIELLLLKHRFRLELLGKEEKIARAMAADVDEHVTSIFSIYRRIRAMSDRSTVDGGIVGQKELLKLYEDFSIRSQRFRARYILNSIVYDGKPQWEQMADVAAEAETYINDAVRAMRFRVRMGMEGQIRLVFGHEIFTKSSKDSDPAINMETIMEYLTQSERENRRSIPEEALKAAEGIMKAYARTIRERLESRYHRRARKLGIRNTKAKKVLASHSFKDILDRKLATLTFMVDFFRAKLLIPTGYVRAMYVWNSDPDQGGRYYNSSSDDPFYGDQNILRDKLNADCDPGKGKYRGCFGAKRDALWEINFMINIHDISHDYKDGASSLEQCARCVQIEESRKKFPKSIFFSEDRSNAQLEAAQAIQEQIKLEMLREEGDIAGLRQRFNEKYKNASQKLEHLLYQPNPPLPEETRDFRNGVRSVVAAMLLQRHFKQRGLPGQKEISGSVGMGRDGEITFGDMRISD